jgi:energy-coupling factor transporter ATP-binding protein EcfA2
MNYGRGRAIFNSQFSKVLAYQPVFIAFDEKSSCFDACRRRKFSDLLKNTENH